MGPLHLAVAIQREDHKLRRNYCSEVDAKTAHGMSVVLAYRP